MAEQAKTSSSEGSKQPGAGKQAVKATTPVIAQYLKIKAANPECLLFYHMGDFYELFFEDAVAAAQALGIQLTKRGTHEGKDIPMCGVPLRRADDYLHRLIERGFRVAVAEQTEDPQEAKKRGAKSIVRREVVRLVTPGTLTEDSLLEADRNNFLTALFRAPSSTTDPGEIFAIASLDISTGEFIVGEVAATDLVGELARLRPSEVLAGEDNLTDRNLAEMISRQGAALTPVTRRSFDSLAGEKQLKNRLGVRSLDAFGGFSRPELAAVAALLRYVELTQVGHEPHLRAPKRSGAQRVLMIDAATRTNLEIDRSTRGERAGSLRQAMDRTVTGAGSRELALRLASPLTNAPDIEARLDAVGFMLQARDLREVLRGTLRTAPDIARALSRLLLARGGPRDLGAIKDGLAAALVCCKKLDQHDQAMGLPDELKRTAGLLQATPEDLFDDLGAALADELPIQKRDGGFVRAGFRGDLDENRGLRDESRKVIGALQAKYAEATGLKSLKIKHNNVLGYFVEVTAGTSDRLREDEFAATFHHRQSLASAQRFTTQELAETEAKIVTAGERALAIELEVFNALKDAAAHCGRALGEVAQGLAELDHYCGLGELAEEQRYCRPTVDDTLAFSIEAGRHPVVEQALAKGDGTPFVENDCALEAESASPDEGPGSGPSGRLWIVTGPNMAGKSTFLRQNAIAVVMAQMGSFVPASAAHIGVVDRLFSRVGAADDIAGGRSTFMVEMVETAGILNQAGPRSMVVLDEIGRGTATFDGLSIAWATAEHLHDVNLSRALFATHYHELTALGQRLAHAANATIEVREWKDDIVFLHKVVAGAADRSYGIQVAKLAGLPEAVTMRAREVLTMLENDNKRPSEDLADELPLFSKTLEAASPAARPDKSELEDAFDEVNPDDLTPRKALEALYRLKAMRRSANETGSEEL